VLHEKYSFVFMAKATEGVWLTTPKGMAGDYAIDGYRD
jgi:hypothetical protein